MKKILFGAIAGLLAGVGIYAYCKHKAEANVENDIGEFDIVFNVDGNMNDIVKE